MKTIAILGNDYTVTTNFMNKIVQATPASIDQEHLKLNIIIDNKLNEKNIEEIKDILNKLKKIDSDFLVLTFNDERIENILEHENQLILLNKSFDIDNDELINDIIKQAKLA